LEDREEKDEEEDDINLRAILKPSVRGGEKASSAGFTRSDGKSTGKQDRKILVDSSVSSVKKGNGMTHRDQSGIKSETKTSYGAEKKECLSASKSTGRLELKAQVLKTKVTASGMPEAPVNRPNSRSSVESRPATPSHAHNGRSSLDSTQIKTTKNPLDKSANPQCKNSKSSADRPANTISGLDSKTSRNRTVNSLKMLDSKAVLDITSHDWPSSAAFPDISDHELSSTAASLGLHLANVPVSLSSKVGAHIDQMESYTVAFYKTI
jgi:hypothetical protein